MKEGSMQSERPDVVIDPVCGMRVSVDDAEADGLLVELDGRTWAFCREACRDAFISEPAPPTLVRPPTSTRASGAGTRAARAA
jgi:YHS domain-containing protein